MQNIIWPEESNPQKKKQLCSILDSWAEYMRGIRNSDSTQDKQLLNDWDDIFNLTLNILKDLDNKPDCFLVYQYSQLQGIALCAKRITRTKTDQIDRAIDPSYHIYTMITAPWNIQGRIFKDKLDIHSGIGTSLLCCIVNYCHTKISAQEAGQITVEPGGLRSNVLRFYAKRMFEYVYDLLGRTYELKRSKFNEFLEKYITDSSISIFQNSTNQITFNWDYLRSETSDISESNPEPCGEKYQTQIDKPSF